MNFIYYKKFDYVSKSFVLNSIFSCSHFRLSVLKSLSIASNIIDSSIERNVNFSKVFWLLEHVGTQKTFCRTYKNKRMGRNDRRVIFSSQLTLFRKEKILNFLYFFNFLVVPRLSKKLIYLPSKLDRFGSYSFVIPDISVFPGYLENFFKWRYYIFFKLNFLKFNYRVSKYSNNNYCLQELGFFIK